ncbi:hypothetical protein [Flavobacterium sp.]|uniref:hypothetical protein n=1 Tax=Flavobacterium sp. TaxID=239 RepID=UPI0025C23235|nr:hypothetical protein [Flavobacterium sp.]MBA4155121.1 hypothetical protein [Flavobacterium sp.]
MKLLYFKYQWFYLIISFIFFGASLFYYVQENHEKNNLVIENHIITEKKCSAAPRVRSFVKIRKENKAYKINLSEKQCLNHFEGEQIALYYNKKYDYFFYPKNNNVNIIRVLSSGIALFILFLPLRSISNWLSENKKH